MSRQRGSQFLKDRIPVPGTSGSRAFSNRPRPTLPQRTPLSGPFLPQKTPLSEWDEEPTIESQGSKVHRESYRPPPDYHSVGMARFQEYFEKNRVEVIVKDLLQILLNRPELPYNPYPGFYGRMRVHQERFHLEKESRGAITAILNRPVEDTYLQYLKSNGDIWGIRSILSVINPDALNRYRWLMADITPRLGELPTSEGYSNQVIVALIGPCVFHGSLYPTIHKVQMRLEFVVTGPDDTEAVSLFVRSVRKDVEDLMKSKYHFLIGVQVPIQTGDAWIKKFWQPELIDTDEFGQDVSDAVKIGYRYIYVECIFCLDESRKLYVKGEKQYGLNFIEVDEKEEKGLSSYCELPMACLHEGVFYERAHAEAYMSILQPQTDDVENVTVVEAGEGNVGSKDGKSKLSGATGHASKQSQRYVHDRLKHRKQRSIKIDGFRFEDEKSTGPFAWTIATPIMSKHQKEIASYWRNVELFDIVYSIIILVLMDRESFGEDMLIEAYRLLHSTSGGLYQLMELNKGLRAIIITLANSKAPDYPIILPMLKQYLEAVEELFLNSLMKRSQDHVTIGRSIVAKVEDMIYVTDTEFASATHLQSMLYGLRNINLYLIPLMIELAEDSLTLCPQTMVQIRKMESTFPEMNPRPPTREKVHANAFEENIEEEEFRHGKENKDINRHITSVLDVQTCISKERVPPAIVKDTVLMKYMLDCRFDQMWNEYLASLVDLPENPYPSLISALRQSAVRMDLFFEKSSAITERMFNLEVQLDDTENYIYHIPGLDAHGSLTSLMMLDTGVFVSLRDVLQTFTQKSYIQKKGPYRVGICLCVSGPCIWFGRMQPYFNEIALHEHYYIQGPSGCKGEAMHLCSLIVLNHIEEMITKLGIPVLGVYFGDTSTDNLWTTDDILTKKKGFMTQFVYTCTHKQPIWAQAYVLLDGWRYVTVTKHFILHFMEQGTSSETFYPDNPAAFYQSVFLTKDRAAFHYQNSGPPKGGDPMSIANQHHVTEYLEMQMHETRRKCDWLNFYWHLLLRDLISQDQSRIADCWRMFHGMASQVEYVIDMMGDIQDLVKISLLYEEKKRKEAEDKPPTPKVDKKTKQKGKNQKVEVKEEESDKNPVDSKALTRMGVSFYQKLTYVTECKSTMAPVALSEYVESILKKVLEFDSRSGRPYLAIEEQTISHLEDLKSLMRIYQDTLSGDVQSVFPDVAISYQPPRLQTPDITVREETRTATPLPSHYMSSRPPTRHDSPWETVHHHRHPDSVHQTTAARPPSIQHAGSKPPTAGHTDRRAPTAGHNDNVHPLSDRQPSIQHAGSKPPPAGHNDRRAPTVDGGDKAKLEARANDKPLTRDHGDTKPKVVDRKVTREAQKPKKAKKGKKPPSRTASVASNILDDPNLYQTTAKKMETEDIEQELTKIQP